MDKVMVAYARALVGVAMLAGLAACGGGSENSTSAVHTPAPVSIPSSPNPPANPPVDPAPAPNPEVSANQTPTIAGNPSSQVNVDQAYTFTPAAADADGDSLTFSIASKPTWASFDAATGRLSGTPTAGDAGSYEQITITVSDGQSTTTLAQFAINVVQQSNGNVTLAWQAPTQNTDGSPLTDLGSYKIHFGTRSGHYLTTITLNNASLTRYLVENLAPGTYYFAISAVSSNGIESDLSGEVTKTI